MDYAVFSIKICVLSIPFIILGALASPFVPQFSTGMASLIACGCIVFGILLIVFGVPSGEGSQSAVILTRIGKIIFLFLCGFSLGCLMKLAGPDQKLVDLFMIPIALIAVKALFGIKISDVF